MDTICCQYVSKYLLLTLVQYIDGKLLRAHYTSVVLYEIEVCIC